MSTQAKSTQASDQRQQAVAHLREMIHDIPIAMFTTVAGDGSLHSRPMVNVNAKFDGDLWFFTTNDDPKVDEIAANPRVNVSFSAVAKGRYVSATGTASIVDDPKRLELHWTPECEPWFPNGPRDPHLSLIKVDIASAEYWDQHRGAMVAVGDYLKRLVTGSKSPSLVSEQVAWPDPATER